MAEHPNAARFREVMDAINEGNIDVVMDALADDVVWHTIGSDQPIRGKENVLASFGPESGRDFEIEAELHDVVANDDHTIGLVHAHATRDGETFDYRTAEIMHMKDGKITERWAFSDDTAAIADYFG